MKKGLSLFLITAMLVSLFAIIPVTAASGTSGDFSYYITGDDTAYITAYTGSDSELTIPSELDGYRITEIGYSAFQKAPFEKVTIPEPIETIGQYAFYNCTSLKEVTFGNSIKESSKGAFEGCSSLNRVNISDLSAWMRIDFATSNANPADITEKGEIYLNGEKLTTVEVPADITRIGDHQFNRCQSIEKLIAGDQVTYIGEYAFSGCYNLSEVELGDGIETIGYHALHGCPFSEITLPDSLTSLGANAFTQCGNLKELTLPAGITYIPTSLFYQCSSLKHVHILGDITSVNSKAFYECKNLAEIELPDSLTAIDDKAFQGCESLKEVRIPSSVTSIGSNAFNYCTKIAKVSIGRSVTSIRTEAFAGCSKLKAVYYEGSEYEWSKVSIGSSNEPLKNADLYYNSLDLGMLTDSDSGIIIELDPKHNPEIEVEDNTDDSAQKVSDLLSGSPEIDGIYDITIDTASTAVIKIPADDRNKKVYQIGKDALKNMDADYKDGYLVFTTDTLGEFAVISIPQKALMIGDVDGDENITIFDASAIQKHIAGGTPNVYIEEAADVDRDGNVTIFDASAIQKHIAGGIGGVKGIGEPIR